MSNERRRELDLLFGEIEQKEAAVAARRAEEERARTESRERFQKACEAHVLPLLNEYKEYLEGKGCDASVAVAFRPTNTGVSFLLNPRKGDRSTLAVCKFLVTYSPEMNGSAEFTTAWHAPEGDERRQHEGNVPLSDLTAKHVTDILQPFIVARLKEVSAGAEE